MKHKQLLTAAAITALVSGVAPAEIVIDSTIIDNERLSFGAQTHTLATGLDASGSDKLVVAVATEHNFGGTSKPAVPTVFLGGVELTLASSITSDQAGRVSILYLDDPGTGDLIYNTVGGSNGSAWVVFLLSGTQAGIGNTSSAPADSTSLTTAGAGSMVMSALFTDGPTVSGPVPTIPRPSADAPQVQVAAEGWNPGREYGVTGSAYQPGGAAGSTVTATWTNPNTPAWSSAIVLVEFFSATLPPGPEITSITPIGGGVWELMLEGDPSTGYEFRSSPILDFSPGTLVENLAAGGVPVGTIGGTNDSVLTTDGDGNGTARMALSGSPADFVRAQTAPLPPPVEIFFENFDGTTPGSLPADWATGTNPADNSSLTAWELGTPANVGPIPPGVPLPSGANCVATNISGNYDDPVSDLGVAHTDIWLRTPAIDLGAATAGTLSFQQWTQIEDVPGDLDYGSIRILDASDDSLLATLEDRTIDGNTSGWEEYSMDLPAEAFTATAGTIKVELRFEADDIDSFAGWYIDDFTVTVPGS